MDNTGWNPNDDIEILTTDMKENPEIKLELDIKKKQFVGAWVDGHHKTPYEFTREVYIEITKKFLHVDGMPKIGG